MRINKTFLVLSLGLVVILAAAGVAGARWGGPQGGGCGYGSMQALSPEAQKLVESSHTAIAPLALELRAKQDELTAKIYSGADSKVIDALSKDVNRLQTQMTEARVNMQQQFAKAGVPMQFAGACPGGGMGGGMHGGMRSGMHGGNAAPAPQGK